MPPVLRRDRRHCGNGAAPSLVRIRGFGRSGRFCVRVAHLKLSGGEFAEAGLTAPTGAAGATRKLAYTPRHVHSSCALLLRHLVRTLHHAIPRITRWRDPGLNSCSHWATCPNRVGDSQHLPAYTLVMRKTFLACVTTALAFSLLGCSAPADQHDTPAPAEDTSKAPAEQTSADGDFSFAHIKSCDDVEPFVATWVEGLNPYDWNSVSETDIHCGWDTPPEDVTPDNARSVEVRFAAISERPDYSPLEGMAGFERVSDEWVTANNGDAFTMTVDIGISAVIGTTIWVPGVEVAVSGGRWANLPELDGPAGLEIAKQILAS